MLPLVRRWREAPEAELQRQDVLEVIEAALDDGLPWNDDDFVDIEVHEPDEEAMAEMQAYLAMHPMLKKKYFGQYVAAYIRPVRGAAHYEASEGQIPGSIRVPPDQVADWAANQTKERAVVTYCT